MLYEHVDYTDRPKAVGMALVWYKTRQNRGEQAKQEGLV